jgi:hypothetical protein
MSRFLVVPTLSRRFALSSAFSNARFPLLNGGVLASPIWSRGLAAFGEKGVREIVYLVGHYCFVSLTLNGFDIPVPGEKE